MKMKLKNRVLSILKDLFNIYYFSRIFTISKRIKNGKLLAQKTGHSWRGGRYEIVEGLVGALTALQSMPTAI